MTDHSSRYYLVGSCIFAAFIGFTLQFLLTPTARANQQHVSSAIVEDKFGRLLNEATITLVDWDGFLANPAVKLFIRPPEDVNYPVSANVSANGARLYFDLPSEISAAGPSASLVLTNASSKVPVLLAIFPDRDGENEGYQFTVELTDALGFTSTKSIPINVLDQDRNLPMLFPVTIDFSKDQTNFFADSAKRAILQQAANDWFYFFDAMQLSEVPFGNEQSFIWNPDGFVSGRYVTNTTAYTGFLLYTYGIHHNALRSGGAGSYQGGFQTSNGSATQLRRSGSVEIETAGNYNSLGWFLTTSDDDWLQTGNLGDEVNDLYSIAHHEIGHALAFDEAYPVWKAMKTGGGITDTSVVHYFGSALPIDSFSHLDGNIDPASRRGAFGYEYFGDVPRRRWLITKLDLLVAQAVGYNLRPTSAFAPLDIKDTSLPNAVVGQPYSATITASGGVPPYHLSLMFDAFPPGFALDTFTGHIAGTATVSGTISFAIRVVEGGLLDRSITQGFTIQVVDPNNPISPTVQSLYLPVVRRD